jgi:hypothetical protein
MSLSPLFVNALAAAGNLVLLVVFALAAFAKLRDRVRAQEGLIGFGMPERLARPALAALVLAELLVAALLAFPPARALGALGALGALAVFTLALAAQLLRGRRPACACFGALSPAAISWKSVARNLLLMALAGALLALPRSIGARPQFDGGAALALATVTWVGISAAWLLLLTRQNGRLLARIERLERVAEGSSPAPAPPAGPLPVGATVPALGLQDARGRPFDLRSLRGAPALLLFLDSGCSHCRPLLARLRETPPRDAAVLVISESAAVRHELPAEVAVLVDAGWSTPRLFGVRGTPAAAALDADGALARPVAHGAAAVRAALDEIIPQEATHELAPV